MDRTGPVLVSPRCSVLVWEQSRESVGLGGVATGDHQLTTLLTTDSFLIFIFISLVALGLSSGKQDL